MLIYRLYKRVVLGDNRRGTKHSHKRNITGQDEL